jgi:molybdopterin/thiamine biosynthesis adenylyltransferase
VCDVERDEVDDDTHVLRTGQQRVRAASVLIIGAGGLGCPCALYLAGAGVGRLTLVDFDDVAESNLARQVAFTTADTGSPKAEALCRAVRARNANVDARAVVAVFDARSARALVAAHDVIVDASDNPATRYLASDVCAAERRPLVWGAALRWEGQFTTLCAEPSGPCYRCLFPQPPPAAAVSSCEDHGVVGPGMSTTMTVSQAQTDCAYSDRHHRLPAGARGPAHHCS